MQQHELSAVYTSAGKEPNGPEQLGGSLDVHMNSEPSVQVHGADHSELRPADISLADVTEKRAPLFVEIFAGRASFSRAVAQAGFEVVSVDHEVDAPPQAHCFIGSYYRSRSTNSMEYFGIG